nr:immunoglobulin heavy chain junction region [Mus musculus]
CARYYDGYYGFAYW